MRTALYALLFAIAGVSAASAQQSGTDHRDVTGNSPAANPAAAPASGNAAAGVPLTPSQYTDFTVNGSNVIRAAPPLTPEQQKAEAEGRSAWQARCRPSVIEDREGIRRRKYAEPDCDLSRYNTAGTQ
jgi:hypothetical protein